MAEDNFVEKLVIGVGYKVDKTSEKAAKESLNEVKKAMGQVEDEISSTAKTTKKAKGSLEELKGTLKGLGKAATSAALSFSTLIASAIGFSVVEAKLQVQTLNAAKSLDISTEQYTSLVYVFKNAGLEADQLTDFLFQLQGQISGAADGSEDLVKVFRTMGINFRDSSGGIRKSADIFVELADGLKNFATAGDRASAIQKLLGENGTKLNPIFNQGSDAIRKMVAASSDLQFTLSEESAAASQELDQSLNELESIVSSLGRTFANELIPKITPLVKQFSEFLKYSEGIVKVGLPKIARDIGYALDFMATPAGKATTGIIALTAAIGSLEVIALIPGGAALVAFGAELLAVSAPLIVVAGLVAIAALAFDELTTAAEGGDSVLTDFFKTAGKEKEGLKLLKDVLDSISASFEFMKASVSGLIELLKTFSVILDVVSYAPRKLFDMGKNLVSSAASANGIDTSGILTLENLDSLVVKDTKFVRSATNSINGFVKRSRENTPEARKKEQDRIFFEGMRAQINRGEFPTGDGGPGDPYRPYVNISVNTPSKQIIKDAVMQEMAKQVEQQLSGLEDIK